MIILQILSAIFVGGDTTGYLAGMAILSFIGMWFIFQKCGTKGWYAFIPFLRKSELGKCANFEKDGRKLALMDLVVIIMNLIGLGFNEDENVNMLFFIAFLFVTLIEFIYGVRVYTGLIEVFDQKKAWIILWATPLRFIPALLWGLGKKYQPLWSVDQISSESANVFSNKKAAVLEHGLTVNLEERTTTEMFQKKYLLRDIHMEIQPGHMVLLLGGSGAGKTTFLNAVNGYEKAKAEVTLNNRNMYTEYNEMLHDIGFVPQQDLMRGSDTVYRTLMDAAIIRLPGEFSHEDREKRVEEVMTIFGLLPVKNNLVVKLSGGQRKRLSIAMEFLSNPTLFILDEPDSGLDGVMARELFEQLRQIADQGKIIIVITHTPDRVIDLFDDVIVLAKDSNRTGRLAYYGPIQEAREFFGKEKMEEIVKSVNRKEEGGEGRADEFILKYAEVQHV